MLPNADDFTSPESVLRDHVLYSDLEQPPEVIETHISRLFLTPHDVYKQKKPVRFDFLDFSNPSQRRAACEAEVAINRRLAPDVYYGVVGVGRSSDGVWHLGDDHSATTWPAEDWLVHMRRLPEERCLATLIQNHACSDCDITAVVEMLAAFYRHLPPVRDNRLIDATVRHILDNRSALVAPDHHLPLPVVERVHSAQLQFAWIHRDLLERRIADGHVIEGHGDLRAEHLYLTEPPVVIDAIEFSRELRTIDVADELAFFAVSCEILGAADFGQLVVEGCRTALGDAPPPPLLDFYASYRACVRAKVAAIRTEQTVGNAEESAQREAERYLDIADRHARRLSPPRAILVRGASGTGKTTLAQIIVETIAARRLSTDLIRRQLSFHPSDRYSEANRSQVYTALLKEIDAYLRDGVSVVIDGTFLTESLQREFALHARSHAAEFTVVTCTCPAEIAMQRIEQRSRQGQSASEADVEVYQQQVPRLEPMPSELYGIDVDTTQPMSELLTQIATAIRSHPTATSVSGDRNEV